jgi:hypothetical protein
VLKLDSPKLIRIDEGRRSLIDSRRRIDWHIYEYAGSDGHRYLKGFETRLGESPTVPQSGTVAEVVAMKDQW